MEQVENNQEEVLELKWGQDEFNCIKCNQKFEMREHPNTGITRTSYIKSGVLIKSKYGGSDYEEQCYEDYYRREAGSDYCVGYTFKAKRTYTFELGQIIVNLQNTIKLNYLSAMF
eukprot:TRINITY_DN7833_c0_g2_i1.p1 TRINITY_DN7833_c0_g2~~TRINITY_DN7833_c0_g2_i1.p1  ORF type:complete len:115 (-),score=22.16 TRINITY_DN7833_c0_g2_i1:72-416(-)